MTSHKNMSVGDNHHGFNWVWPTQTERDAQASLLSEDILKSGLQQDTNAIYMLVDLAPTWTLTSGSTIEFVSADVTVDAVITLTFAMTGDTPLAARIWFSFDADGSAENAPAVTFVTATTGIVIDFGNEAVTVASDLAGSSVFDVGVGDGNVYVCWTRPSGQVAISGPYVVTPIP